MEWIALIEQIFNVCIIPLLGVLTAFVVQYIRTKTKELNDKEDNILLEKYTTMLSETVISCVLATQQTYVETLKKEGKFDQEAQMKAFEMTKNAILSVLSEEAKKYLITVYGDLNMYIGNLIEAQVKKNKLFLEQ